MSWFSFRPYVPVAQRRARAARELAKMAKKSGQKASPVILEGRQIAATFWGKAWCDNLEAYSDYANRLPRGRSYIRNGSVVDLQIGRGKVTALVSGSSLYQIEIKIKPIAASLWKTIQAECAGKIDSLIELLQGTLSSSVMQVVTRPERGLFPSPKEIDLDCSCPDWADLCKHVAASLYGVGARLDRNPELLFLLRGVDPADLISKASAAEAVRQAAGADAAPALSDQELTDVFGIEIAAASVPLPTPAAPVAKPAAKTPRRTGPPRPVRAPKSGPVAAKKPKTPARRRLSPAAQALMKAAMKARWAKAKAAALERKAGPKAAKPRRPSKARRARAGSAG